MCGGFVRRRAEHILESLPPERREYEQAVARVSAQEESDGGVAQRAPAVIEHEVPVDTARVRHLRNEKKLRTLPRSFTGWLRINFVNAVGKNRLMYTL